MKQFIIHLLAGAVFMFLVAQLFGCAEADKATIHFQERCDAACQADIHDRSAYQ